MSELLGKETIDASDYSRMYGTKGHYTRNDRIQARDLLTPDEVRMIDNRFALLFIRGERPVMDLKYDLMKHPNVNVTADGKGLPYIHGEVKDAVMTIGLTNNSIDAPDDLELDSNGYVLLSEDEIEEIDKETEVNNET